MHFKGDFCMREEEKETRAKMVESPKIQDESMSGTKGSPS